MYTKATGATAPKRKAFWRVILALLCTSFVGCTETANRLGSQPTPGAPALRVAVYKYVPRLDQFQTAIRAAWRAIEPGVPLEFVDWNCYSSDPMPDLDVFVFDAIFLDYFQRKGFLAPIEDREVDESSDILPYGLDGSRIGGTLFGIPQLACASVLFYRSGDTALEAADSLADVSKVIGESTYAGTMPPPGKGLMVDLSGSTTDSCLYLDALEDIYGKYTPDPPLPPDPTKVDPWAIQNLWSLQRMASAEHVVHEDNPPYQRAIWFGQGLGRALIGFTEAMSAMGDEGRHTVAFKLMPLSDRNGVSLFYADIIGVNAATVRDGKRALAVKLANMMASTEVIVQCIGPTTGSPCPQYLMPVRKTVFARMRRDFPLYGQMFEFVIRSDPRLFRLGVNSRPWLTAMKSRIKEQILSLPRP